MRQFVLGMYGRKERFYNYGKYVDVFVMLCGGDDLKGRFSVGQYRAIDLTLFAFMLIIFETIAVSAATRWFPAEPYTVSVVAAVTAIVMLRWGIWGAIHAVLGGIVFCRASGGTAEQYAIYCIGNLLALGALGLKKAWGTETIRQDALKTMLFGGLTLVLMQLGRFLVSLVFGASAAQALGFFTTDVISLLFTLVIIWIVRRLDGMLEDQNHYLLRVQKEQEEEKGGV